MQEGQELRASRRRRRADCKAGRDRDGQLWLHSSEYKTAAQLRDGPVLVVGCGNSVAEIAHEIARTHKVLMTAKKNDEVPFDGASFLGRWPFLGLLARVSRA